MFYSNNMILLLWICFVSVFQAQGQYYEGDECTENGQNGTCRNIKVCPSAIGQIAMRKPPMTCSFRGSDPIVCCLDTDTHITPTPSSPEQTLNTTEYVTASDDYSSVTLTESDGCKPLLPLLTSNKTGRKAWDKCIEYQVKYVYPCEEGIKVGDGKVRANRCGTNAQELIVRETGTYLGEFPFMVLLGYGNDPDSAQWKCGGTLLSEKFVMTAAHCTSFRDGDVTFVRTATLKKNDRVESSRVHRISRVMRHPDFRPPMKYNDIALLEMETEMNLDHLALPACLPVDNTYNDSKVTALGYGIAGFREEDTVALQQVTFNKFSTAECTEKFPPHRQFRQGFQESSQLCYGDRAWLKFTCLGDSGGPLVIKNQNVHCMSTVVGLSSFGHTCSDVGEPGIYTKVAFYTPWIESIVWPK